MWHRSEMAQKVGANDLAESYMAFNTNYNDSGLFGIYAVAKVRVLSFKVIKMSFSRTRTKEVAFDHVCLYRVDG